MRRSESIVALNENIDMSTASLSLLLSLLLSQSLLLGSGG
jgi:hypothetical protein